MRNLSFAAVGAVCALATVAGFVAGIVLMGSSGVETLIPETGEQSLTWIADVEDAGSLFFPGASPVVFAGLFGLIALVGFYDALQGRRAARRAEGVRLGDLSRVTARPRPRLRRARQVVQRAHRERSPAGVDDRGGGAAAADTHVPGSPRACDA
jgi:hypothetical protein